MKLVFPKQIARIDVAETFVVQYGRITSSSRSTYRTFGFRCPVCSKGQVAVMFPFPMAPLDLAMGLVRIIHADGSRRLPQEQVDRCGLYINFEVMADIARKLALQAQAGIKENISEFLLRRALETTKPRKSVKRVKA